MTELSEAKAVDYSAAMVSGEVLVQLQRVLGGTGQRRRISELTGIPAPTLKDYYSGRTPPTIDRFLLIAFAAGLPPDRWFRAVKPGSPAAAPEPIVRIPVLDVSAGAGAGRSAGVVSAVGELPFPVEFAARLAPADARLSCLRCSGNSMSPTIADGAIVIIDERQKTPPRMQRPSRRAPAEVQKDDDIFVFYQGGDLRLKRLRDLGDGFRGVISDNAAQHPIEIHRPGRDGALSIIGRVIWWDNRL